MITRPIRMRSRSTMLKVVGVLIKVSARDRRIGLMNWYHGRVETTPPEQCPSEIITLPYFYVLKNRDFRRYLKIGCFGTVRVAIYDLMLVMTSTPVFETALRSSV